MTSGRWGIPPNMGSWRAPRELEEMGRWIEQEVARPFMRAAWSRVPEEMKGWSPSIDVIEKGDAFIVRVELPGVKEADFAVSAAEDSLEIKGERKVEGGVKSEEYYRNEIAYGHFYRSVALPAAIDTKSVEATYEDGILRVTLQRAVGSKPKKVTISVKKEAASNPGS